MKTSSTIFLRTKMLDWASDGALGFPCSPSLDSLLTSPSWSLVWALAVVKFCRHGSPTARWQKLYFSNVKTQERTRMLWMLVGPIWVWKNSNLLYLLILSPNGITSLTSRVTKKQKNKMIEGLVSKSNAYITFWKIVLYKINDLFVFECA